MTDLTSVDVEAISRSLAAHKAVSTIRKNKLTQFEAFGKMCLAEIDSLRAENAKLRSNSTLSTETHSRGI